MPLSRAPPPPEEHAFARPPALEALRMLPIAARVGAHIYGERRAGREPIFDMNVSQFPALFDMLDTNNVTHYIHMLLILS